MSALRDDLETAMEFYLEVKQMRQCQFNTLLFMIILSISQLTKCIILMHVNNTVLSVHTTSSALFFSQAVMLDSTDVNMWYKIGQVAVRLVRIPLARHAFEEGLHCNPDHWPCLDNLITILYTLSDYTCM